MLIMKDSYKCALFTSHFLTVAVNGQPLQILLFLLNRYDRNNMPLEILLSSWVRLYSGRKKS